MNESARLAALRRYEILDTQAEATFDELTRLAAGILDVPISLVSLVDETRVWVKSGFGLETGTSLDRTTAYCAHTVAQDEMLIVPDLRADERFRDYPLNGPEGGVRFYAGQQLTANGGHNIGTLCVMDTVPRHLSEKQKEALRVLGRQVMSQIELRKSLRELTVMQRKALALESILQRYTSRSIWHRADLSASQGMVTLSDQTQQYACLFMDAVGFTPYAESNSPDLVIAALNDYFDPVVASLHAQGGDIDKFVGDQIFAIFESSAAAIRAAISAKNVIDSVSARRQNLQQPAFAFRMGLNFGSVVRGNIGNAMRSDNTLIGDMVNVAARLQAVCEPGGILAAENMEGAAIGIADCVRRVQLRLRGRKTPVRAVYLAPK
ncbi:MAG: GAF domain-containing protein [Spirochaetales bacterium]|nr:GAF domain-containing protein [Spirochaetales bacterium]